MVDLLLDKNRPAPTDHQCALGSHQVANGSNPHDPVVAAATAGVERTPPDPPRGSSDWNARAKRACDDLRLGGLVILRSSSDVQALNGLSFKDFTPAGLS